MRSARFSAATGTARRPARRSLSCPLDQHASKRVGIDPLGTVLARRSRDLRPHFAREANCHRHESSFLRVVRWLHSTLWIMRRRFAIVKNFFQLFSGRSDEPHRRRYGNNRLGLVKGWSAWPDSNRRGPVPKTGGRPLPDTRMRWWIRSDSNRNLTGCRPAAFPLSYEPLGITVALPMVGRPKRVKKYWRPECDSNAQPAVYETAALPVELSGPR